MTATTTPLTAPTATMGSAAAAQPAATPRPARKPVFHPLRVEAVRPLTDDAVAIQFCVPPQLRDAYAFVPGQHLTVRTTLDGVDVRRNYSICSAPSSGRLEIAVKRLAGGAFSEFATHDLAPGDVLEVMTPTGHFGRSPDPTAANSYAAIAAGSGITPVLSLMTALLEFEPASDFTLVYGNRTAASTMFLEEIADLKNRYPGRLTVLHVLSREPQDAELLSGRIDRAKLDRLLETVLPADGVDAWYLCGPFELVQTAREALAARGVPAARVHFELFHVEAEPPARRANAAEEMATTILVTLDGRATSFDYPPDAPSILDAVLRIRADAPFACKGGVCGTCRSRLIRGEVEMARNYALEPDELARGYVLACQSRPLTPEVELDFDA